MRFAPVFVLLLAGCPSEQKPNSTPAPDPEICDDSLDNDGDNFTDCSDSDCATDSACLTDLDGDGVDGTAAGGSDCDDNDPTNFPGNTEVCDGRDNDCDGLIDDNDPDVDPYSMPNWYRDLDGDGWGMDGQAIQACAQPPGAVADNTDCNDDQALLNNDDVDGDGFSSCDGDCDDADPALNQNDVDGDGSTTCSGDCDDNDAALNQADDDGDGWTTCDGDCDDLDALLELNDIDGDGYTTCAGDCNDLDFGLTPNDGDGDGLSSCDGDCDDTNPAVTNGDNDGDGFSSCAGDCDDTDAFLNPADADGDGNSTCDGDCDDADPTVEGLDLDGDGYSTCDADCDDLDAAATPADADGDGWTGCMGDCALSDPTRNPGAYEIPGDCIDQDCDGYTGDANCAVILYTVRTVDDVVRAFDTQTLTFTDIGPLNTGFDFGELAWDATNNTMYMIDGRGVEGLHTVDMNTGNATLVGIHAITDLFGLAVDSTTGIMYAGTRTPNGFYTMDKTTGAATYVGNPAEELDGMAYDSTRDEIVGLEGGGGNLVYVDRSTGATSLVVNAGGVNNCGLAYDPNQDLYWAIDWSGNLYTYDPVTLTRTLVLSGLDSHDGFTYKP